MGRIAVFEILQITPKLRDLIYKNAGRTALEAELKKPEAEFVSLAENAVKLVEEGITTPMEVLRIINEVDLT